MPNTQSTALTGVNSHSFTLQTDILHSVSLDFIQKFERY